MWKISKDSVDVLDLPELHRRKLIKLPEREQETNNITRDGFFDLSDKPSDIAIEKQAIEKQESPVTDFLSDFASIGASNTTNSASTQQVEPKKENNEDVKDLKWRIENLEFKLEQLIERINSINK